MKTAIICIIGLVGSWGHAKAESLIEGRVRLDSGAPVAGAQVLLFDLTDLRAAPLAATTDRSGQFTLPLATLGGALPEQFELGANYPNPFNPSTMIPYQLPVSMHVRLEVFNILGQRVATLVDGERPAGFHTAHWDATDAAGEAVAAGVYLYRLSGDGVQATRSMLLIDGQAGIPSGRGGSTGSGGEAGAGEDGEAASVYGLAVSGPGLVAYVDPAFRVEAGMAPLDLVVEAPGRVPPAKAASSGGILGDVDNTGDVDFFDALLVALYSHDSSIVMPNNGDISLGDVDADGQVDLSDAWAIAAWLNDPSNPALPAGIGEPVASAASLSPDPSTVTFADDGAWHRFTVAAGEPVSVVANPGADTPRLEITTRSGRGNYCPAEADDDQSRQDGQTIYLSGCSSGQATVELRRESDGTVLRTYTFEVTGIPADLVVESVSVSDSTLTPGQSFTLSATVRNQGTAGADATTLRYYRSTNRTISTRDTQVGTDAVGALAAAGTGAESISLTAPSTEATYYYGACVESLPSERGGNNCSAGVRVIVEEPDTTPVIIPGVNLRAAIEDALGKTSAAPITQAEMATLGSLDASDADITDLTGLEFAVNLTELDLGYNNIADISPLSSLTNLTVLFLNHNSIMDISALSGLTNLTSLNLWANSITDISPLSSLTNLTVLHLKYNKNIADISPLSGLTNLTVLRLSENNIQDISALSGLTKLTVLWLWNNRIEDISALSGMTNLRVLRLTQNEIQDISALSGLTNLTDLWLDENRIEDISALSGMTNLTWLWLKHNNIADISALSGMTNLTVLRLSENNIQDISALSGLTNLEELWLQTNKITDIPPLSGLTNLRVLRLGNNRIRRGLSWLSDLTNLQVLWLGYNKIKEVTALSDLSSLTDLDLLFNDITEISALSGLTRLTDLDLRGNPLGDFSIKNHIPAFRSRGVAVRFDSFREDDFDIELVFLDHVPEDQKRVMQYAARRWMSIVIEDLPDLELTEGNSYSCGGHSFEIPSGTRIDDLRIYVTTFEGEEPTLPFAWCGPAYRRELSRLDRLPAVACMGFDLRRAGDNLLTISLHEIAHGLGFDILTWEEFGFLQDLGGGDEHFNGPLAIAAFDDAGGRDYAGAKVPVFAPHWTVPLRGELMYGDRYKLELSAITVQSLADLGYGVDVTQADPYTLPIFPAGKATAKIAAAMRSIRGLDVAQADVHTLPGADPHWQGRIAGGLPLLPGFAHRDDRLRAVPKLWCGAGLRRGPIHVVDPQGRIVRTLGY